MAVTINNKTAGTALEIGTGAGNAAAGNHDHTQLAALVADYNAKRMGAHLKQDVVYVVNAADAVGGTISTCYALANQIKEKFNNHAQATQAIHVVTDEDYQISYENATTLETLVDLTNSIISNICAHMDGGYHYGGNIYADELMAFSGLPVVEDAASCTTWLNRMKYYYNLHRLSARIIDGAEI